MAFLVVRGEKEVPEGAEANDDMTSKICIWAAGSFPEGSNHSLFKDFGACLGTKNPFF